MTRYVLLSILFLSPLWPCAPVVFGDSPASMRQTHAPNSSGIYWIAFSSFPNLNDEQKKTLNDAAGSLTSPLTGDLKPVVAAWAVPLHELQRARKVAPCDWQLDIDAGPNLQLSHLQKARELSRVALLRARMRFAAGEREAALDDCLAVLKMARDCGSSPIIISLLVDIAIEKMTIDVLAAHLPQLNESELKTLEAELSSLPPSSNLAACIAFERQLFGGWLERRIEAEIGRKDSASGDTLASRLIVALGLNDDLKPKADNAHAQKKAEILKTLTADDLRESFRRMDADYVELARIAALPESEREEQLTRFEAKLASARLPTTREEALGYFSTALLPTVKNVHLREVQMLIRRDFLRQAVRVQRDGPGALVPFQGKPVEHVKTATGFELRYTGATGMEPLAIGGKP